MKKFLKIGNLKFIKIFKSLPLNTRKLLSIGILFAFVIALPLFVFAIVNQRFDLRKRAATSEPPTSICAPVNKVITVTPLGERGNCHDLQNAINSITGEGFTVKLTPGTYDIYKSIDVSNKQKITIQGDRDTNSKAVHLEFNNTSFGFRVTDSSGIIEWMDIGGKTKNGMISITNSKDFSISYAQVYDTGAPTLTVGMSSNISVGATQIQDSVSGIMVYATTGVKIMNNKIRNSNNALTIRNSSDVNIKYNLIYSNQEAGISISDLQNSFIQYNTFFDNAKNGTDPTVSLSDNKESSNYYFTNNLVINSGGPGIFSQDGQQFTGFTANDFYGNHPNYSSYPDKTGTGGNISKDPLIDITRAYCLKSGSPAIYGNPSQNEYMGNRGPCSITQTSFPSLIPTPYRTTYPTRTPYRTPYPTRTPYRTYYPTPTPYRTPTPPPTATGTGKMKIRVKFAGVSNDSADGAKVSLRVYKESYHNYISSPFNVYHVGNGIYEGLIQFAPDTSVYPGSGNTFYIKGEKHLSRKFCFQTGQTELCRNTKGQISLYPANSPDIAVYDFTGLPLEPGDLLPQDGMVDSRDFQKIKTLLNKLSTYITQEDLYTGDLNYDGKINIFDAFLLRKTLETKYDED